MTHEACTLGEVVEVDAAHGQHAQVVDARGRRWPACSSRVAGLERPGDEGREAARLVLQVAEAAQMLDALRGRVERAEHHRRRGRHADAVGLTHDVEPGPRRDLVRADGGADAVDEHLGAAAGQEVQPGGLQALSVSPTVRPLTLRDVRHLGRRERVDMHG